MLFLQESRVNNRDELKWQFHMFIEQRFSQHYKKNNKKEKSRENICLKISCIWMFYAGERSKAGAEKNYFQHM